MVDGVSSLSGARAFPEIQTLPLEAPSDLTMPTVLPWVPGDLIWG